MTPIPRSGRSWSDPDGARIPPLSAAASAPWPILWTAPWPGSAGDGGAGRRAHDGRIDRHPGLCWVAGVAAVLLGRRPGQPNLPTSTLEQLQPHGTCRQPGDRRRPATVGRRARHPPGRRGRLRRARCGPRRPRGARADRRAPTGVLLLGASLPASALAATPTAVKAVSPATKLLVVAGQGRGDPVAAVSAAGADGVLPTGSSSRQLANAIRAVSTARRPS